MQYAAGLMECFAISAGYYVAVVVDEHGLRDGKESGAEEH